MTCGILLVTHPGVGTALLDVATRLLRQLPLKTEAFEVPFDADMDALLPLASAALRRVDSGEGVLILTDLYGASPANLAGQLARLGTPVRRVSALSLPMLLRVKSWQRNALRAMFSMRVAQTRLAPRCGVLSTKTRVWLTALRIRMPWPVLVARGITSH